MIMFSNNLKNEMQGAGSTFEAALKKHQNFGCVRMAENFQQNPGQSLQMSSPISFGDFIV
jgi:hypothetical protein